MNYIYDKLMEYNKGNYRPFHMPGHKRNTEQMKMENPYGIDITEIDGFDNLHDANGILKQAMERAARLYGAEETFFLVNGSSCGILAGIGACTMHGDKILAARNCHKSVYHAIYQGELKPVYLYPEVIKGWGIQDAITPDMVRRALKQEKDIRMVVITSPTYEGVIADIKGIAAVAHEYGIPLLVDAAHGAHMGVKEDGIPVNENFAKSAIDEGADIVVQSVHKTLSAFTQSAILHVQGVLVRRKKLRGQLAIYQSSSPSYILMAGIDNCMEMLEEDGNKLFAEWNGRLNYFYKEMKQLQSLKILDMSVNKKDKSKIIISTRGTNITGHMLYEMLLHSYQIQAEMESADYVILMTGAGDRMEDIKYLAETLLEIDSTLVCLPESENVSVIENIWSDYNGLPQNMTLYKAQESLYESVDLDKSVGRVAADYIYLYPPGVPLIVPGEEISEECVELWKYLIEKGLQIKGLRKKNSGYGEMEISVVRDFEG